MTAKQRTLFEPAERGSPAGLVRLELPDAECLLEPAWLAPQEADALLERLSELAWTQEHVVLYGRTIATPRLTAWYGDEDCVYAYSGLTHRPLAWTAELDDLRARLEALLVARFNGVLCNLYRDGADSMGWHSDDEPELGAEPVIASVSLGQVRTFQMRHRTDASTPRVDLELGHGSLLVMRGPTQRHWRHALPKRRGRALRPRINLTYRRIAARTR